MTGGQAHKPYWKGIGGPPRRGARFLHPLATGLVRTTWRVRILEPHHVPPDGPVILAGNHTGMLDGPLLYAVVRRPVHAIVKQEMFRGMVGRGLQASGQISVDRFNVDPGAVKAALAVLDRGDALAIYPEGTRGVGDFARIKPGVAYLALCTGAPVVPVACLGIRRPGRAVGSLPRVRSRVDVVFGPAVRLAAVPWPRRQEVVREQAVRMREHLVEHVRRACELTGWELPGLAPDAVAEPGPVVSSEGVDAGEQV